MIISYEHTNMELAKIDFVAAHELKLYADNDSRTYFAKTVPIQKNLLKKIDNGTFDKDKAVVAFMYVTEFAARRYCAEFGGTWNKVFNNATRKEAARNMVIDFVSDIDNIRTI